MQKYFLIYAHTWRVFMHSYAYHLVYARSIVYDLIDKDVSPGDFFVTSFLYDQYLQEPLTQQEPSTFWQLIYVTLTCLRLAWFQWHSCPCSVSFVLRLKANAHQGFGFLSIQEITTILQMQRQWTKGWESSILYSGKVLFPSAWSSLESGLASTPVTLEGCSRSSLSHQSMRLYCFFWSSVLKNYLALTRKLFLTMKQWHFTSSGCVRKMNIDIYVSFRASCRSRRSWRTLWFPL